MYVNWDVVYVDSFTGSDKDWACPAAGFRILPGRGVAGVAPLEIRVVHVAVPPGRTWASWTGDPDLVHHLLDLLSYPGELWSHPQAVHVQVDVGVVVRVVVVATGKVLAVVMRGLGVDLVAIFLLVVSSFAKCCYDKKN